MRFRTRFYRPVVRAGGGRFEWLQRLRWGRVVLCFLAVAVLSAGAQPVKPGSATQASGTTARAEGPNPAAASGPARMGEEKASGEGVADASAEQRKQVAEATANLLKLATDLKAEVDKSTSDTLSIPLIRKAEDLEKAAQDVREEMGGKAGRN